MATQKPKDYSSGSFDFPSAVSSSDEKFCRLKRLVEGVAHGQLRHVLVVGPQGIGKTFSITATLRSAGKGQRVNAYSGHMAPMALYKTLWEHRTRHDIVVFDDCDSIMEAENAANILKAATDTIEPRKVAWITSSKLLPAQEFVFDGRIILTTNVLPKGKHAGPILDRFIVFNLNLSTTERVARIITVLNGAYRSHQRLGLRLDAVLHFIIENHSRLGESLTLRTAIKCLEIAATSADWEDLAEDIILSN